MMIFLAALALPVGLGGTLPKTCVITGSYWTCKDRDGNSFTVSNKTYDWKLIGRWPDGNSTFVERSMTRQLGGGKVLVWLKTEAKPSRGAYLKKSIYDCAHRTNRLIAAQVISSEGRVTQVLNVDEHQQKDIAVAGDAKERAILNAMCGQ